MDIQVSSSLAKNPAKPCKIPKSNGVKPSWISYLPKIFSHFFGYPATQTGLFLETPGLFSARFAQASSHHGSKRSRDFALLPRVPAVTWLGSHRHDVVLQFGIAKLLYNYGYIWFMVDISWYIELVTMVIYGVQTNFKLGGHHVVPKVCRNFETWAPAVSQNWINIIRLFSHKRWRVNFQRCSAWRHVEKIVQRNIVIFSGQRSRRGLDPSVFFAIAGKLPGWKHHFWDGSEAFFWKRHSDSLIYWEAVCIYIYIYNDIQ